MANRTPEEHRAAVAVITARQRKTSVENKANTSTTKHKNKRVQRGSARVNSNKHAIKKLRYYDVARCTARNKHEPL